MSLPTPVGVTGTISYKGQVYDFSHNISQFDPNHSIFPHSEGPRSIVTGNDQEQRDKYITAYEKTDQYVDNLFRQNAQKFDAENKIDTKSGKSLSKQSKELLQLTHCIQQTRQETDHVLTMVMNNSFPSKRQREAENDGDKDMSDRDFSEEVKRQRALDTTEYFSGSEDEGDGDDNVKVQI
jgi:hypothetical protein